MSYPRAPGASYGGSGDDVTRKGSVKAARERAQAEQEQYLRADYYGQPPRPTLPMSQYNVRPPTRPQANPTPPSSSGRDISRSPAPNWPLPDNLQPIQDSPPRQKGPPPQRPPRPSYVPSILDPTKPQSTHLAPPPVPRTPGSRRREPEPEPEPPSPSDYDDQTLSPTSYYPSPREHRPITTSSMASNSSLGSIPDFPVPNMPQSRKSPNLGPPPSARRGPSSYYSQMSYVSPIVEEAESNRSHNSFASSNVIPNAEGFYFDEDATPSEEDLPMASPSTIGGSDDGRSSRATDDGDQAGLVRHASLGKRGKPSLTTIKSVDSFDRIIKNNEKQKKGAVGQGIMAAGAAGGAFAAGYGISREPGQRSSSRPDSEALSSGTGLFPPSASGSSDSVNSMGLKRPMKSSPLARSDNNTPDSPVDPRVDQILGGLERGGALGAGYNNVQRGSSLADRVGNRRPPRLNVDVVREAEARGSLTSLPDLIRRATRLASNLDRGKTASRLGLEMWEKGGTNDKAWEAGGQRASTMSDILTAFPPPGIGTPTGERYQGGSRPVSRWPSGLGQYEEHHDYDGTNKDLKKQGRRCCGMPVWCFVILMLILFLLVAAAVIVPIVLIVLPKQNDSGSGAAAAADSSLAQCQQTFACENGGSSVVDPSGHCSCMCVNGFTGDRCTRESDAGCTTTRIGGRNATIGSAMPSLISTASDSFQIPLNGSELLNLFSSSNLSCTAENALVTFNGVSSSNKRSVDLPPPAPMPAVFENDARPAADAPSTSCSSSVPTVTAPPELKFLAIRDDYHSSSSYSSDDAATKYGIVYDSSPASSNVYYSSYSATPTGTTAASATSSALSVSKKRLQFARVGVLFVLQESDDLSFAVTAQENLQTYFTEYEQGDEEATAATAVNLGNSFAIDLSQWHITLPNGTQVGRLVE
ncbi:Epidermal growth factor-like type 3 [Botryosphaeria dothidea]|uniref:Epidermal growth factor-like type 3 n=1 Tax=Botryosphaeria dothidea TaxID=55169 RepID=A0A8H4N614_9PEZI|nr:Epidermal growth factor-like type 3 [Botryosphaeria dothidea]